MVVWKELNFNSFYIRSVWSSWKNSFLTVSNFAAGVVVLKELIFNSFYFAEGVVVLGMNWILTVSILSSVWFSWKNWFLTVSNFADCGGLERTDF